MVLFLGFFPKRPHTNWMKVGLSKKVNFPPTTGGMPVFSYPYLYSHKPSHS